MADQMADLLAEHSADDLIDLAAGRWEPCGSFATDHAGSPVCSDCGWIADDHRGDAVIHRLPARAPKTAQPRRLAS